MTDVNKNTKKPSGTTIVAAKKGKKGFSKGASGNPAGRPKGAKNKLTLMAQELLEANAEEIVMASLEKAKAGNSTAQKFWLERIMPMERSKLISIALPTLETPQDIGESTMRNGHTAPSATKPRWPS